MQTIRCSSLVLSSALLLTVSCGGDAKPTVADDASTPTVDAGPDDMADTGPSETDDDGEAPDDGGVLYAQLADGSDAVDEVIPKSACALLSVSDVAAVLGQGLKATEGAGGEQCQFASTNPDQQDVGALLEEVTNGKAIFAGNLDAYASAGIGATPVAGFGDQATFTAESMNTSSMQVVVGDLVLRLNLGWGDPGVGMDTQLAGEKQLLKLALDRL